MIPVLPLSELVTRAGEFAAVCLATPAEVSLEWAPKILAQGVDVVDLSGAFRLRAGDAAAQEARYLQWYGTAHGQLAALAQAQYGLAPWCGPFRRQTTADGQRLAALIANPGCYATSILMAVLPLLRAGLIDASTLVIDAKSGTTGAGRKASEGQLFSEVDGECLPYKVGKHQHLPEIADAAQAFAGLAIEPMLATHLLNVRRGILSSHYVQAAPAFAQFTAADLSTRVQAAYTEAYAGYGLARVTDLAKLSGAPERQTLSLKRVVGSARTHIAFQVTSSQPAAPQGAGATLASSVPRIFIFSLIDNLMKGAASQAVENLNRLHDLSVTTGLMDKDGVL